MMDEVVVRHLGRRDYLPVLHAMQAFTHARTPQTGDEIWIVEHAAVFTLGQAGRTEHLLNPGRIPVIRADRGGQITYHGPGQLVVYLMLDLRRLGWGIRQLVTTLENAAIHLLSLYGIAALARPDAPGVYVEGKKIASLGLRVRKGCCYHGLSLNVAMDLEPFGGIEPCGHPGLEVTQLSDLGGPSDLVRVGGDLLECLTCALGYRIPQGGTTQCIA